MAAQRVRGSLRHSLYQNPGQVNKGSYKKDLLVIKGCSSRRFGEGGEFLREKNWILQLGKGYHDPSVGVPPPPKPPRPEICSIFDLCICTKDTF